jgi:hypothetical protein
MVFRPRLFSSRLLRRPPESRLTVAIAVRFVTLIQSSGPVATPGVDSTRTDASQLASCTSAMSKSAAPAKIYIGNLHWSLDDDAFKTLLASTGGTVVSAKVAVPPRRPQGKSERLSFLDKYFGPPFLVSLDQAFSSACLVHMDI